MYDITLDTKKGGFQAVLEGFVVGDTNTRSVCIRLMQGLKPYPLPLNDDGTVNYTATLFIKGASASHYSECAEYPDRIEHTFLTSEIEEGFSECEIKIVSTGKVLTSAKFKICAEAPIQDDGAIAAENSFSALTSALAEVQSVSAGLQSKVDKVDGATEGHLAVFDGEGGIKDGGAVPSGGGSGGGSGEVTANIYTLKYAEPPADPGYWTSATNPELFAALDAIRNDIVAGKDIAVLMDVNPSSGYNHVINASAYLSGGGISVYGKSGYNEIYLTYSIRRPRGADKVYLSKEYTYESDIDNVGTDAKAPTVNFVVDLVKKEISESGESWTGAMTKLASGTIASGTAANTKTDTGVKYSQFKLWHRLVFMRKSSAAQGNFSNGYGYENNAGFRDAHKFLSVVLTHIDGYLWHYRYFATDTVVYSQPTDAVRTGTTETLWSEGLGSTSNCDISEGYLDIRLDNKSHGFTDDNTFQIKNWSELTADVSWAIYALTLEG